MPGGSDYAGSAEALEQYRAVVAAAGFDVKGAKNPYTSHNGHMVSFLDPTGVFAIHLSSDLEAEFRGAHDSGPVEQYGRTMNGYSSVPAELFGDTEASASWLERATAWIDTLPPQPTKKPKKS